ncbi:MAG: copper chaperone [Bacteroidales bacterium]|jgi:mercuric ion binding protein|nr:copper chaperone [Bacteroidales bacterium]
MKTKVISLGVVVISAIFMISCGSSTTDKNNQKTSTEIAEASFEVRGNCDMCEDRIENIALAVDGVSEADWKQENEMLLLSYDESETSVNKVQMAIAEVGHDTPMHKAKDNVYDGLPACCQYDRSETEKDMDDHDSHQNH